MIALFRLMLTAVVGFFVLAGTQILWGSTDADSSPELTAGGEGIGVDYWGSKGATLGPAAKIALGNNANAVLSLDLIVDGGAGNRRDDGVTTGAASGRGTKIAIELFATGVATSLRGFIVRFDFDASLVSYVKAENSAFGLSIPEASVGTNLASASPVTLAPSGFLARAEFETVADVTGREFTIGIEMVTIAESSTSRDEITTARVIRFNVTPSPDFDGDGTVGFSDFLAFAGSFGSSQSDARYEARFDLDGDGSVGFSDFLVFAGAFGSQVPPSGGGSTVTIADDNLRAVIADSLGKARDATVTRTEMATLTRFAAPNMGIRNLTGIEYATNLQWLWLGSVRVDGELVNSNHISDLSPLSRLTNLTYLNLTSNRISSVSALSRLTNLTQLHLGGNRTISDISALSNLTMLSGLNLWGNSLSNISELSRLTDLSYLGLSDNGISDISPLVANAGLGNGDAVDLRSNPLSSTSRDTHIPTLQRRGVTVEFDSGNNGGGGGTTPPSRNPDLIVESPSVDDNTLTTGQSFTLRATVRNQGSATAAATTLRYYRSSNATVSTDDTEVGTDAVSGLSAGGTSAESIRLNAPSDAGTYYYGACVDGVSGESRTGNNCSSGVSVSGGGTAANDVNVNQEKRKKILNFPNHGDEGWDEWHKLVLENTVDSNVLDITGCKPNPLVLEVGYGEVVEIKNAAKVAHTLLDGWATAITIPAGGSRDVVVTEFLGSEGGDGIVGYFCDDKAAGTVGIFYVKASNRDPITFRVISTILPDDAGGVLGTKPHNPGIGGVKVTPLNGFDEGVKETADDGKITFIGEFPLTVRLEKEGYVTTEAVVTRHREEIVLTWGGGQTNISFRVVEPLLPENGVFHPNWPQGFTKNGPGIGGVTVTPIDGSDEGIKRTDANGKVVFFGTPPLTVRLEKPGYVTIETMVVKEEIIFPNEWPSELDPVIKQLELGDLVDSGQLILSWAVEVTKAAFYDCGLIHISKFGERERDGAMWTLVHETMHARQALESGARCGGLVEDWPPSKEGQAWIAALSRDLEEHGENPHLDNRNPLENLASFYADWHMGSAEKLQGMRKLSPNRWQYMEDRFGPPPPR